MPIIVPFETLTDLYLNLSKKYAGQGKAVFHHKLDPKGSYEPVYWDQVTEDVQALAAFMIEQGIEHGDRVAILSENRYEWAVVDLAIQLIGGVNVSLYTSLPSSQCEFILQDSESKLFFVSTGIQVKKAVEVFESCENLSQVVAFDVPKVEGLMEHEYMSLFETVREQGGSLYEKHKETIKERAGQVKAEDISTLIYTSGTTGRPKGAMLTHNNIVSNVKSATTHIYWDDKDKTLSFLPLCHSFERTAGYYAIISSGAEIYYAESVDTVSKNLPEVKPTVVISVPRLF